MGGQRTFRIRSLALLCLLIAALLLLFGFDLAGTVVEKFFGKGVGKEAIELIAVASFVYFAVFCKRM